MTSAAAIIVFARADGGRLTAADSAKVTAIAATLDGRHIRDIVSITAGPPSPNHLVQTALVAMPNSVVNGIGHGGRRRHQGAARRHQAAGGRNRA